MVTREGLPSRGEGDSAGPRPADALEVLLEPSGSKVN
jgi:hypothetical protein